MICVNKSHPDKLATQTVIDIYALLAVRAMSPAEIEEHTGRTRNQVNYALQKLKRAGEVDGSRGNGYRLAIRKNLKSNQQTGKIYGNV